MSLHARRALALVLIAASACDPVATAPTAAATADVSVRPEGSPLRPSALADDGGMTLRLPWPGTSREDVLASAPECGTMAPLRAQERDRGVDLVTPCELPPGCEMRDYGEVPSRTYRWTPREGLRRVDR